MDNINKANVDSFNVKSNETSKLAGKTEQLSSANKIPSPEVKPALSPTPTVTPQNYTQTASNTSHNNVLQTVQSQSVHTDSATARDLHNQSLQNLPAEDSDLIEKEWVDKTEQVIETSKDDPYVEDEHQHELSRTYLKKRFNLDVK